jgi:poly-gamma-glutamate synthesis protein (capsule biosynthesis protein)
MLNKVHKMPGFILAFIVCFMIAPEPRPITLALVGDLMIGRGVARIAENDPAGQIFNALRPWISSADLAFGNLESPVSENQPDVTAPYNLCAGANGLRMLKNAGFDLLSTENNHKHDCEKTGQGGMGSDNLNTVSLIRSEGMTAVDSPTRASEVSIRGIRLVFLAADDVTEPVDIEQMLTTIKTSKQTGAVVVISLHWGIEYQASPTPRQKWIARSLAEAGADMIIGHHPHIAQRAEWIMGDHQGQQTLVLYSLGNALFDQHGLTDTRRGTLAFVQISPFGTHNYSIVPFAIDINNGGIRLLSENN